MGASIYVGTFLLGNNWSYRLVFLLFVIPQLGEWMRQAVGFRRALAYTATGLIILTCWYLFFRNWAPTPAVEFVFVFDQLIGWALFGSLVYLMAASVPMSLRYSFRSRSPQPSTSSE